MKTYEAELAHAQETSDGWMQAYYRQTSRLLRAESGLRDIRDMANDLGDLRAIRRVATSTLEEIKE